MSDVPKSDAPMSDVPVSDVLLAQDEYLVLG